MLDIRLILILIVILIFYLRTNPQILDKFSNQKIVESPDPDSKPTKKSSKIEGWRDLPYIGNKDTVTYHKPTYNYSRKSLPIYYPISSPLEDEYFNYLNSISSPKLSYLRNIMRKVETYTNQGKQPIIFNYAERPFEVKKHNPQKIKVLADTVIELLNKFGEPIMNVKYIQTLNEVHEETDQQSRMTFDLKISLTYSDSEYLGKKMEPDILYIQPEFIFERAYDELPEDRFFKPDQNGNKFKSYLSKLILVGSEHMGFLGGRYQKKFRNSRRRL